jgi:hypothetical protein
MLTENLVRVRNDLQSEVVSSKLQLQKPVRGDSGGFKSIVTYLTVPEADEFDNIVKFLGGIPHSKLDDLGARDPAHVFTPSVGHTFNFPEVTRLHPLSTILHN